MRDFEMAQSSNAVRNMPSGSHVPSQIAGQMSSGHNSVPKQRLKSATMNKRIQRGFSRENDDGSQYEDGQPALRDSAQQYQGYTGHMSNSEMPQVPAYTNNNSMPGTRQSKTSSGQRGQVWKGQAPMY